MKFRAQRARRRGPAAAQRCGRRPRYSPCPQLSAAASRELHTWPAPCAGGPGAPPRSTATSGACEEMRGNEGVVPSRARLHGQAPPSTTRPRPPQPGSVLHSQILLSSMQVPPPTAKSRPPGPGLSLYSQDTPILPLFCPKACPESSRADRVDSSTDRQLSWVLKTCGINSLGTSCTRDTLTRFT